MIYDDIISLKRHCNFSVKMYSDLRNNISNNSDTMVSFFDIFGRSESRFFGQWMKSSCRLENVFYFSTVFYRWSELFSLVRVETFMIVRLRAITIVQFTQFVR